MFNKKKYMDLAWLIMTILIFSSLLLVSTSISQRQGFLMEKVKNKTTSTYNAESGIDVVISKANNNIEFDLEPSVFISINWENEGDLFKEFYSVEELNNMLSFKKYQQTINNEDFYVYIIDKEINYTFIDTNGDGKPDARTILDRTFDIISFSKSNIYKTICFAEVFLANGQKAEVKNMEVRTSN